MEKNIMEHWHHHRQGNIVWLGFNKRKSLVNTIDVNVLTELKILLDVIEKDKSIQGLIINSHKSSGFILGADVQTISFLMNEKKLLDFIYQGQLVFKQLTLLNISTVALINGFCLGGGLELALACRFRIAIDDQKTRLGLPEVKLGIHSGWGGTVRLPRLLGAANALKLMLTGRIVSAPVAFKLGLVDWVVSERHAISAALYYANMQKRQRRLHWRNLSNFFWIRNGIALLSHRRLTAKINPTHYPAPFQILKQWKQYGVSNKACMHEAKSLSQLAMTSTARNLIHVYFLRERLTNLGRKNLATVKHIHVIGAGIMGGDIAAWCALQGLYVTLQDLEPKYLALALGRAFKLFKKRLKNPRDIQMAMDRLIPDLAGSGIRRADLIIEAVFEDLLVKQNLFQHLETQISSDVILATNTSSILLEQIQQGLKQPERLIGLHFFNPVLKMPLVEVVQSKLSSTTIVEKALAFVHQIKRLPLPVKSFPGFLINRLLIPYLLQAVLLLETGVPAVAIDKTATDFGMPIGPLELADTIGLDICLTVAKLLIQVLQSPLPECLEKMVANKHLGRKTGQGFYRYNKGKLIKEKIPDDYESSTDFIDRLIQPMVEEAKRCLQEKVVADSDLLDAGMIFGGRFAPFRGGLLRYAYEKASNKGVI